jgi:phytoene dehydrogenase-like protein
MVLPAATFMRASPFLGNEMTQEADAIVVGSGINGLVAAVELAQAGWSVILVERNAKIGGFIATEERALPGDLHDTFSSWHRCSSRALPRPQSASYCHQHGLEYWNTEGGVADDGRATLVHRDPERTASDFAYAEDRSAYLMMLQRLGANMASIGGLFGSNVRSLALVRHMTGLVRRGGLRGSRTKCPAESAALIAMHNQIKHLARERQGRLS